LLAARRYAPAISLPGAVFDILPAIMRRFGQSRPACCRGSGRKEASRRLSAGGARLLLRR